MDLTNIDLLGTVLKIENEDGTTTCIPEEIAIEEELLIIAAFREQYPDGKLKPIMEPITPIPTDSELIASLTEQLKTAQDAIDFIISNY